MSSNYHSPFDPGGVLKNAHAPEHDAIRILNAGSLVPVSFERIELTYDGNENIDEVFYYKDIEAEVNKVDFIADVSSSLNNKYILMYSGADARIYYIWYNVNGAGVDPAIPNATGIEVNILPNDFSAVVTLATYQKVNLNSQFLEDFGVLRTNSSITFSNLRKGVTTDISDNASGFTFTKLNEGTEKLVRHLKFTYDGNQNITSLKVLV